ncbi:MAG: hypothetical protein DID92_2727743998 [Candidatus Nitrotoga sp. SPKER]|nr:MAG: hypothetical protein DID92_2727743998 [Candidatus Nitrotoga sp. SPKER]
MAEANARTIQKRVSIGLMKMNGGVFQNLTIMTGFDDKQFIPEELEAIYIGHQASQEHKNSIFNILREKYQGTKIFLSNVNIQDYSMIFHENR